MLFISIVNKWLTQEIFKYCPLKKNFDFLKIIKIHNLVLYDTSQYNRDLISYC